MIRVLRSGFLYPSGERRLRSADFFAPLAGGSEGSLRRALRHYEAHYHEERNHQGKDNILCYSLCRLKQSVENRKRCGVGSGWAVC